MHLVRLQAMDAIVRLRASNLLQRMSWALHDRTPSVRSAACLALSRLADTQSAEIYGDELFDLFRDVSGTVRAAAVTAVGELGLTRYCSFVGCCLQDQDTSVREAALGCLAQLGEHGSAFMDEISECLADDAAVVRAAADRALRHLRGEDGNGSAVHCD